MDERRAEEFVRRNLVFSGDRVGTFSIVRVERVKT